MSQREQTDIGGWNNIVTINNISKKCEVTGQQVDSGIVAYMECVTANIM